VSIAGKEQSVFFTAPLASLPIVTGRLQLKMLCFGSHRFANWGLRTWASVMTICTG